jgi:hypothetical protein
VAIEGTGFFQVQRPDGTIAYTRAGQFHLNNQGTIVTTDGDPVIPTITIPPNATAVTITQYGVVNATLPGQQNPSQLGQIQLATFPNPGGLESMGNEPAAGHAQLRRPGAGQPRRNRGAGHPAAGVPGELECGRGHHVCADGAGAAGLRIELQGHQGRRRYVSQVNNMTHRNREQGSGNGKLGNSGMGMGRRGSNEAADGSGAGMAVAHGLCAAPAAPARRFCSQRAALVAPGGGQGEVVREIDDPHTGDRWLLKRNDQAPGGPGRLVLVAARRNAWLEHAEPAANRRQTRHL